MRSCRLELEVLAEIENLGDNATFGNLLQMMLLGPRLGIVLDPYPLKTLRLHWPANTMRLNVAIANLEDGGFILEIRPKRRTLFERFLRFLPDSRESRMAKRYELQPNGWHLLGLMPPNNG